MKRCSKCGVENWDKARFCAKCGTKIDGKPEPENPASPNTSANLPVGSGIKFCCPACSQKLEAPPEMAGKQIDCPVCGKPARIPLPQQPGMEGVKNAIPAGGVPPRHASGAGEILRQAKNTIPPKPTSLPPGTARGFTKHAFISHSSKDHAVAERVCEVLESSGVSCWIAPRDIEPGVPYDEEIIRGIKSTQTFILLLSEASNESLHVKRELSCAIEVSHTVYPIRIQEVQPGSRLEYLLEGIQWVDAWTPPLEAHLERLATLIKTGHTPNAASARRATERPQPVKRQGKGLMVAAGITVALAALAAAWFALVPRKGAPVTSKNQGSVPTLSPAPRTLPAGSEKVKRERYALLLNQAALAETSKQWQTAVNAYEAALALFDEADARTGLARAASTLDLEQVAARNSQLAATKNNQAQLIRQVHQTVTLSWVGDPKAGRRYPSSQQVLDEAGDVHGELEVTRGPTQYVEENRAGLGKQAYLDFTGATGKIRLCVFRVDDPIGQTRVGKVDNLSFSGRVTEVESNKDGHIGRITVEVTVSSSAQITRERATTAGPTVETRLQGQGKAKNAHDRTGNQEKTVAQVDQKVMLNWTLDPTVDKQYPSSDQILDSTGDLVGGVRLIVNNGNPGDNRQVAHFEFAGSKGTVRLCDFRFDDPVGQVRVGRVEGMSIAGRVTEIKKNKSSEITTITVQVTAKR